MLFVTSCFNEEEGAQRLREYVSAILRALPGSRFAIVNNGSTDRTGDRLRDLFGDSPECFIMDNVEGVGWGDGVRTGLKHLFPNEPWVCFPSDLQYPETDVIRVMESLKSLSVERGSVSVLTRRSRRSDRFSNRIRGVIFRFCARTLLSSKAPDPSSQLRGQRLYECNLERLQSDFRFDLQMNNYCASRTQNQILEVGFVERESGKGESSGYFSASWTVLKKTLELRFRGGMSLTLFAP